MGYTSLDATAIAVGKPLPYTLLLTVKNDLDYLNGLLAGSLQGGNLLTNGDFEIDSDADGRPDNWTITTYAGGEATLVTTATTWAEPICGGKTLVVRKPAGVGNGGAYVYSDYVPCSTITPIYGDFILSFNTTAVSNEISLAFYNKHKAYLASHVFYDTTYERSIGPRRVAFAIHCSTITGTRYCRLVFSLGSTLLASSALIAVDDVRIGRTPPCQPYQYEGLSYSGAGHANTWANLSSFCIELPYTNSTMLCSLQMRWWLTCYLSTASTSEHGYFHARLCRSTEVLYLRTVLPETVDGTTAIHVQETMPFLCTGGYTTFTMQGYVSDDSTWSTVGATVAVSAVNGYASVNILSFKI